MNDEAKASSRASYFCKPGGCRGISVASVKQRIRGHIARLCSGIRLQAKSAITQ